MAQIRNRLSAVLGEKKMSIKDLERQAGVSYPSLLDLYHERSIRISFPVMASICEALGKDVGELFYLVPSSEKDEHNGGET